MIRVRPKKDEIVLYHCLECSRRSVLGSASQYRNAIRRCLWCKSTNLIRDDLVITKKPVLIKKSGLDIPKTSAITKKLSHR